MKYGTFVEKMLQLHRLTLNKIKQT